MNTYVLRVRHDVGPAVDDSVVGLFDGESQLLHVRGAQTNMAVLAGQREEDQARMLSARHHVTFLRHHQPVSAGKRTLIQESYMKHGSVRKACSFMDVYFTPYVRRSGGSKLFSRGPHTKKYTEGWATHSRFTAS